MATRMGLLGKKIGMTQTFDEKGTWVPLTAIEVGPCVVLNVRNVERDGYAAIQLGYDDQKAHRVNRPMTGQFSKANSTPKRFVREIRLTPDEIEQFQLGQTLALDQVFEKGDLVDIVGTSKGKGFQGVMKRHHFSGFSATHGTHEYFRHGGSIGCRLTPGRVTKGRRMGGQMGNERVTVQNIRIYDVVPEKSLVLLKGSVPGAPGGYLVMKHAAKRFQAPFELLTLPAEPQADAPTTGAGEATAGAESPAAPA